MPWIHRMVASYRGEPRFAFVCHVVSSCGVLSRATRLPG